MATIFVRLAFSIVIGCIWKIQQVNSYCLRNIPQTTFVSTKLNSVVESSIVALAAGSVGGILGVGAAYPLDALKTKAQTYASSRESSARNLGGIQFMLMHSEI